MYKLDDYTEIPLRYYDNGVALSPCYHEVELTSGLLLSPLQNIAPKQTSCFPDARNAGNLYSWITATTGGKGGNFAANSICPKSWKLTDGSTQKGTYYYLLNDIYQINGQSDLSIRSLPFSYVRSGFYYGSSLFYRGSSGLFLVAAFNDGYGSYALSFGNTIDARSGAYHGYGPAVRCIAR